MFVCTFWPGGDDADDDGLSLGYVYASLFSCKLFFWRENAICCNEHPACIFCSHADIACSIFLFSLSIAHTRRIEKEKFSCVSPWLLFLAAPYTSIILTSLPICCVNNHNNVVLRYAVLVDQLEPFAQGKKWSYIITTRPSANYTHLHLSASKPWREFRVHHFKVEADGADVITASQSFACVCIKMYVLWRNGHTSFFFGCSTHYYLLFCSFSGQIFICTCEIAFLPDRR